MYIPTQAQFQWILVVFLHILVHHWICLLQYLTQLLFQTTSPLYTNVQSLASKPDILYSELCDFDVLAFSETWLSPASETGDLQLSSFAIPERKDRVGDNHSGVILYVKENLYYHRRLVLETGGVECIWIELILKQNLGFSIDRLILMHCTIILLKTSYT